MFTDLYIPERFGKCSKGASRPFSHTQNNTENFDEKYQELLAEYKHTLYPFGVNLLSKDSTKVMGFVIDLDDHPPKEPMSVEEASELTEKLQEIVAPIELGVEGTQANNGIHLWCLFNQPVEKELFFKFTDYVHARLGKNVEIFPSTTKEGYWIRMPGLHKNYTSWSYEVDSGDLLDTYDKVENFLDRYTCDIEVFEEYIQENKVTDFALEKIRKGSKKKRSSNASIRPEILNNFVTGIQDEHFEAIWLYATDGQQCPVDGEQICCPFHDDNTGSGRIYYDKKRQKRVYACFSSNCAFHSDESAISRGHDGFDILSWKVLNTFEKTKENIQTVMEFFSDQIMSSYIAPYLMPKGKSLTVNYIKLTESISRYMYEPSQGAGDIEIRSGEDHILYFYNSANKMWEPAFTQNEEKSKIHMTVKNILTRLVGRCGLYQLNSHGINKTVMDIQSYIYMQKPFRREYLERPVIPCKNGLIDIEKLQEGDWEGALVPYKKEHYITKTIGCEYDPKAENIEFRKFIDRILPDKDLAEIVLEYLATCLCPNIEPQKCQIWIGEGKNGKGTLCNIMEQLFGDVYLSFGLHDLAHQFRASMLDRAFLTIDPDSIMSQIDQKTLASLKKVTGGDTITGEEKFKNAFTFKYQGGFIVCTNNIPRLGEANYALFRRLLIVPFTQTIEGGATVDKFWKKVVDAEGGLPGILNELLRALLTYLARNKKFKNIDACNILIKEFAEESDPIMSYISSLFETNMNISHNESRSGLDNTPPRLTHEQLADGVTSDQLFEDFELYSKRAGTYDSIRKLKIGLPKFRQNFLKRAENTPYTEYIDKKRGKSGNLYVVDVLTAREKGGIELKD